MACCTCKNKTKVRMNMSLTKRLLGYSVFLYFKICIDFSVQAGGKVMTGLPQEIYQTAKLAKLLLKSQNDDINEELDSDINSDDDHTHNIDDDNLQDGLASTEVANENTGQACESERQEPFSKRRVITANGNIRRKLKTRASSSESEGIAFNERCPKTTTHDKHAAEKPNIKHPKIRWTPQQKAVTKHFKENIKKKKPPTEVEIEAFRKKYTVMENKDWKKIKAFIFNKYKKL